MARDFRSSDEGKRVMTHDGKHVGTITQTSGSKAHVEMETGLSQSIRRRLGWAEDADTYELDSSSVDKISGDEIHLRSDL